MAKKDVIEVVCERCNRTEYIEPAGYSQLPDLVLQFGSKSLPASNGSTTPGVTVTHASEPEMSIKFEDLCSSCKNTIRNLANQIGKKIDWKRKRGDDAGEGAGEPVEVEVGS